MLMLNDKETELLVLHPQVVWDSSISTAEIARNLRVILDITISLISLYLPDLIELLCHITCIMIQGNYALIMN